LIAHGIRGCSTDDLALLPTTRWDQGLAAAWTPGELGAQQALDEFAEGSLERYSDRRDLPAVIGTSRLSPHLHFGEISPRQIVYRLLGGATPSQRTLAEPYLRQLGWRDFGAALLHHFPNSSENPLRRTRDSRKNRSQERLERRALAGVVRRRGTAGGLNAEQPTQARHGMSLTLQLR